MHEAVTRQARGEHTQAEVSFFPIELDLCVNAASPDFVSTSLGHLWIRRAGSVPVAVLWHVLAS
jgi:hypothetical protein